MQRNKANRATFKARTDLTLYLAEMKGKSERVSVAQTMEAMKAAGHVVSDSTVKAVAKSLDFELMQRRPVKRSRSERQTNNVRRVRALAHCVRYLFRECGLEETQLLKALCRDQSLEGFSLRNAYPSGKHPDDVDGTLFQNLEPSNNGTH